MRGKARQPLHGAFKNTSPTRIHIELCCYLSNFIQVIIQSVDVFIHSFKFQKQTEHLNNFFFTGAFWSNSCPNLTTAYSTSPAFFSSFKYLLKIKHAQIIKKKGFSITITTFLFYMSCAHSSVLAGMKVQ